MEGTLSFGIYDKRGTLVRVLHREATEKNFTIGLNGLITTWDGKGDNGRPLPPGTYYARGYAVGSIGVEGMAIHGNDWITDDDSPRYSRVLDFRRDAAGAVEIVLKTTEGSERLFPFAFTTEPAGTAPPEYSAKVTDAKVMITQGDASWPLPLDDGASAVDVTVGAGPCVWAIVKTATGGEVRQYSIHGEFLRRLGYSVEDPQPRRILASAGDEEILLLEENASVQRTRALRLSPGETLAPPADPAAEAKLAPEPSSVWKATFERSILLGQTFEAVRDRLKRPGGKPFTPEKEFVVKLVNNPLLKDEPTTAHVNIGFNARGSYIQTTDGLPLRRLTQAPNIQWAVIGREGSGRLLTILQSDGAVIEEFRATRLANMMLFDAGEYEWDGK